LRYTTGMSHVTRNNLRQNLEKILDEVVDSREPMVVAGRAGKRNVVLIAEAEFAGWQETVHLLRGPANARRLLRSIGDADEGKVRARTLATRPGTTR
jgi:antitoxin YefM